MLAASAGLAVRASANSSARTRVSVILAGLPCILVTIPIILAASPYSVGELILMPGVSTSLKWTGFDTFSAKFFRAARILAAARPR